MHHTHRLCVAPMMELTDRHARFLLRLLSRHSRLYTEMVTAAAVLHGDRDRLLGFHPMEHPLALQLGGGEPELLAAAAGIATGFGYDEINLNCGCPSDRVQKGAFGACLMLEPERVADCVRAMRASTTLPVTVKCRIGVDERDSYEELCQFVAAIQIAGCDTLIVHARKAWLSGLSPRQNREIPPLDYARVARLKREFPDLQVIVNGGIASLDDAESLLDQVDGVMIGRAAYYTPWMLAAVDRRLFGDDVTPPSRTDVMLAYARYIEQQLELGVPLSAMTRHALGLFHGEPGARRFRRVISENAHRPGAGIEVVHDALAHWQEALETPVPRVGNL